MKKVVCLSTFLFLLLCSYVSETTIARDIRTVQIAANGGALTESEAIVEDGITLIPIRTIAEIMNAKIGFEGETGAITVRYGGATLRVWANDEFFEFGEHVYGFPVPTATRNDRVFVPLRTLGEVMGYSTHYDQVKQQISLIKHGFGQDGEIREKLEAYFNKEGSVADLFTLSYPDSIYWEDSSNLRKLPRRSYDFWMGDISYSTAREAVVSAGYRSETQTLKSSVESKFTLLREGGTWKIADSDWVHFTLDLPEDADETADRVSFENPSETQKVLSDLKDYIEAMNGRKLESAMVSLSPYFIEEWERMIYGEETYREFLKELFESPYPDNNKLLDARVLYLGDAHAVVHARVLFSQTTESRGEESREYELLIDMDRTADGRWTYYGEWDLDGDY